MELKTYHEEPATDLATIHYAEQLWGKQFPGEYRDFLLQHNGAIVYPNYPTIDAENNEELWAIERFLSIGDVILQQQYDMVYTLKVEHSAEDLAKYDLNREQLLTFAIGERGCYYINLSYRDFGRIYFCNYSGGEGLVKVSTTSFHEFIASLGMPEWAEEEYDPDFEIDKPYYPGNKIFHTEFFTTEKAPELGLQRFREVFAHFGDVQPSEAGYPNLTQKYVYDRPKLDFLLAQGCNAKGLLRYARDPEIIKYLIEELGHDINEAYNGRYPLQIYLTPHSAYDVKNKYQLVDKLLRTEIPLDWTILDNTEEPLLQRLTKLHEEYLEFEISDQAWWVKNGKPSGHQPFPKSKLIEAKLGIRSKKDSWWKRWLGKNE